jgi:ATP-dependent RNA helicase RhlE
MITFRELNLNTPLINALDDLGVVNPTSIQSKVFSVIMSGKDVLGIAQTGTGKTFAYLLPCLRQWKFSKIKNPQILIIVPTRELVVQVAEEVRKLSKYLNLIVGSVYGGANINTQAIMVSKGLDVLVATPGRLLDLMLKGSVNPKFVKHLIIDEVDEMLSLGFRFQLTSILEILPVNRQNLMFSATLTDEVESLLDSYFNFPVKIEAAPTGTPLDNISQTLYNVPNFYSKVNLLTLLLTPKEEMSKVLVFTASRKLADDLFEQMEPKFPGQVGVIHSNKAQNFRFRAVDSFQKGEIRILIATDIIARGLDISEVSHVFNFDLPDEAETYIHRIGRTGRYDKMGIAISFVLPKDWSFLAAIESLMKMKVEEIPLPSDLVLSEELTDEEQPKFFMKEISLLKPAVVTVGPAFHEKSEKNQKTNYTIRRKDKLKAKYKKPKTRGQKPTKRPK